MTEDSMTKSSTAILVLGFIRPHETIMILESCLSLTTFPVFVSLDGPRNSEDSLLQKEIIQFCSQFPDRISILHQERNLGCKEAVLTGLRYAADQARAEIVVVLEDDCLPTVEFFDFVQKQSLGLQKKYLSISAGPPIAILTNFQNYESNLTLIHGWAMSRKNLKRMLERVSNPSRWKVRKEVPFRARVFWYLTCLRVELGLLDTWDAHWMRANWTFAEPNLVSSEQLILYLGQVSTRDPQSSETNSMNAQKALRLSPSSKLDEALYSYFFPIRHRSVARRILAICWFRTQIWIQVNKK